MSRVMLTAACAAVALILVLSPPASLGSALTIAATRGHLTEHPTRVAGVGIYSLPTPPVSHLTATRQQDSLLIRWQDPAGTGANEVLLSRAPGLNGARSSVLYTGLSSRLVDRRVKRGVRYTYSVWTITAYHAKSAPVTVSASIPPLPALYAPASGSHVTQAPWLRWLVSRKATYYNVQLYLNGKEILSAWPRSPRLRLHGSWSYGGARHTLVAGTYEWYVWPGLGAISAGRYGHMLGEAQFTVS